MLAFDEGDAKTILYSVEEIAQAIAAGRIAPDTRVTLYFDDRTSSHRQAVDHALLAPLFRAASEPEVAAPAALEIELPAADAADDDDDHEEGWDDVTPAPAGPWNAPVETPARESDTPVSPPADDARAPLQSPTPRPNTQQTGANGCGQLAGWGLAALVGIVIIANISGGGDTEVAPAATSSTAEAVAPAPAPAPVIENRYLSRWAIVRTEPRSDAAEVGQLSRGDYLTGHFVPSLTDPTHRWMQISEGAHKGYFVWAENLQNDAPPPLDASTAGEYRLITGTDLLSGPASSSPPVSKSPSHLASGTKIRVFGSVDGFAEVEHEKGGVAYVPWDSTNAGHIERAPRKINVRNNCATDMRVLFAYREGGSWQTRASQIWYLDAKSDGSLTFDGEAVMVDSPEIYYYDFGTVEPTGVYMPSRDRIMFDGRERKMTAAIPTILSETYDVVFC